MNLTRVRPGDTVECNVRGRVFNAVVVRVEPQALDVDPPANHTYYRVAARQVVRRVSRAPA